MSREISTRISRHNFVTDGSSCAMMISARVNVWAGAATSDLHAQFAHHFKSANSATGKDHIFAALFANEQTSILTAATDVDGKSSPFA